MSGSQYKEGMKGKLYGIGGEALVRGLGFATLGKLLSVVALAQKRFKLYVIYTTTQAPKEEYCSTWGTLHRVLQSNCQNVEHCLA